MGVRRAVEMALDTANRATGPVYTYGPLIHNPQVLAVLAEKGVEVLEEIPAQGRGTVIIRAHGVAPGDRSLLEAAGFTVVDATCPRVVKVQSLIRRYVDQGYGVVIAGDPDHPEVRGLLAHAGPTGRVAASAGEVDGQDLPSPVLVVAQTTQDAETFQAVVEAVKDRLGEENVQVFNTICDSTSRRQTEAAELAAAADAVVVVGGSQSGNTRRLAGIAKKTGKPVFQVETETELDPAVFAEIRTVALTAGASTPHWLIRRVHRALAEPGKSARPGLSGRLLRALFLTNLLLALGAASMCLAAVFLMGLAPSLLLPAAAAGYILSMHILNNFIGRNAFRYNDPERARFYERHRSLLLALAGGGIALCLFAGAAAGIGALVLYAAMTVIGLSYNVPLRQSERGLMAKYPRIRSLPGSKTLVVSLGWAIACALGPAAVLEASFGPALVAAAWVFCLLFARTAFFDVLDVQVDRMVGQETAATWLGAGRTLILCRWLLAGATAAASLLAWSVGGGAWLLVLVSGAPAVILVLHGRGLLHAGWMLEVVMDANFFLAGLLALAGRVAS